MASVNGGDSIIWNVYPSEESKYYLRCRYSGSISEDFDALLYVNDELEEDEFGFSATSDDTTWKYTGSTSFRIDAVKNTIKLVLPSITGTVNIDHMKMIGSTFVDASVGFQDLESDNGMILSVFPNPAGDFTTVQLNATNESSVNIELISINGSKVATVYNGTISIGLNEFKIDTDLLRGYYIIKVVGNENIKYQKLLVE